MPRILLIDDNEEGRKALSEVLQSSGFDVVMAADGERGLALSRSEEPDVVLMDMNMPVLDGWQAARMIRAHPDTRHLSIIGLTGHSMPGDKQKAIEAGCNGYHTKPIDFPLLVAQIETVLKESQAARAAAESKG